MKKKPNINMKPFIKKPTRKPVKWLFPVAKLTADILFSFWSYFPLNPFRRLFWTPFKPRNVWIKHIIKLNIAESAKPAMWSRLTRIGSNGKSMLKSSDGSTRLTFGI